MASFRRLFALLSIEIFAGCAKYFRNAEGAENAEGESAFSHPSNLSALSAPSAFLSLVAACRAMFICGSRLFPSFLREARQQLEGLVTPRDRAVQLGFAD